MKCIGCGADVRIGEVCEYCGTFAEVSYYKAVEAEESPEKKEKEIPKNLKLPCEYTVKRGDTLWHIAKKFYGRGSLWGIIAKENRLKDPNIIYPGQILMIP